MPRPTLFLDTSFIVALANNHDPHHKLAKKLEVELLKQRDTLVLHWGIVLEIGDGYARLDRRERGIELLNRFEQEEGYLVSPITEPLLGVARQLYLDRKDKEWGLTDCVSFVLMRQEGIDEALTADVHFRQAGFKALLLDNP